MEHEHLPWIGADYWAKPLEDRVLIVGFSHWGEYDPEDGDSLSRPDDPNFTINVFKRWVRKDEIQFFNSIADYFQAEVRSAFWDGAAFANTLPTSVGLEEERYSKGSGEQRAAAEQRALLLVSELRPGRIFVFSKKAWAHWPDFTGTLKDGTLRGEGFPETDCGTYEHADGEAIAFGFRHPQFAPKSQMMAGVAAAGLYALPK